MSLKVISLVVFVAASISVCGCGASAPRKYQVTGGVTYKGKPVTDGDIIFTPANPRLAPVAGKIKNGTFSALANEGKCRVEITALDIGPNTKIVMGSPMASNYIPAKYNQESTLSVDVLPNDKNVFTFPCDP